MLHLEEYQQVVMVIRAAGEIGWQHFFAAGNGNGDVDAELAARTGISRDRLEVLCARWAGVGLARFLSNLGMEPMRKRLVECRNRFSGSRNLMPAGSGSDVSVVGGCRVRVLEAGKDDGAGMHITHVVGPSPFGECFLGLCGQEICHLSFVDGEEPPGQMGELRHAWPLADISAGNVEAGRRLMARIFTGEVGTSVQPLPLLLKGTIFQLRIWLRLLTIPRGDLVSYQDLAVAAGYPAAWRAAASAVGANPVGYLVPCHRVIRKSGAIGGYRRGIVRKLAILGREACRS